MPAIALNTLKGWFVTAAKPLQAHYHAWLDSFWHKNEDIPIDTVEGLTDALNTRPNAAQLETNYKIRQPITASGDTDYGVVIPDGMLIREIILWSDDAATCTIRFNLDPDKDVEVTIPEGRRWVENVADWFEENDIIHILAPSRNINIQINTF